MIYLHGSVTDVRVWRNPDAREIPPGTECRGAVWVVDQWMDDPFEAGRKMQGRAHWQAPEGYEVTLPEGDFERPLAVRAE